MEHLKNTWLASSGSPHNAHGPLAGPLRLATFKEVGSLSRNICQRNNLIFSGNRALQSPATTSCDGPRHNFQYRDLTENFSELVSAQLTESGWSESSSRSINCRRATRLACSCP